MNGAVDVTHRLAEVFAAMRGNEKNTVIGELDLRELCRQHIVGTYGVMECIDDGVARHEDAPLGNPLRREVIMRRCSGCKMKRRNTARQPPIHLLGER